MSAPRTRWRPDSIAAEAAFRARIAELGGRVVGPYANNKASVECICPAGHTVWPTPVNVLRGQGMCRACARNDPIASERAFRTAITERGGQVVGPYVNVMTPVACLCPAGHTCFPRPNNTQQGKGMCPTCARKDPAASEEAFRSTVSQQGGRVVGPYVTAVIPVECVCPEGHACSPRPSHLQRGEGMCRTCAGKTWDVFYVVTNPTSSRVKFGVTSGDPRGRLYDHRTAGYTNVVCVLEDMPNAHQLERHILTTLRDAGIPAVQGREYFDVTALPVVLDVVDGWTSSTTAA